MTLEQVQSKLDLLKANLAKLDDIPQRSFEEFSSDFRNLGAALYLLQTSIQGPIDLASYLVAIHALPVPRTSHEIFERLEEAGLLPQGTGRQVAPIVGFRNRIVHLYDRIDERRVYEILTAHRQDLAKLLDLLLAVVEKQPGA
jgi:uncharacterized protein YutE (UPF0331/DUF86 family)